MGKAKKRSFQKGINDRFNKLTRTEAVEQVVDMLKRGDSEVYALITLFGLTAEEILEGGANFESVKCLGGLLN